MQMLTSTKHPAQLDVARPARASGVAVYYALNDRFSGVFLLPCRPRQERSSRRCCPWLAKCRWIALVELSSGPNLRLYGDLLRYGPGARLFPVNVPVRRADSNATRCHSILILVLQGHPLSKSQWTCS
jgi:hypothetical protein